MRYFLTIDKPVLNWLVDHDDEPHALPLFPERPEDGLVVAHLIAGDVVAEVIPTAEHVAIACGSGIPLGRLYFHVPKHALYDACKDLNPAIFGA